MAEWLKATDSKSVIFLSKKIKGSNPFLSSKIKYLFKNIFCILIIKYLFKFMFLLLLINSLFALTYIIIEYTLHFINPLILLMLRMNFSGLFLLLFQFIKNPKLLIINKKDYIYIFITCILHMYVNFLSETYALQKLSSIMVSIFYLLSPVFSAIIDYIITKNKLKKQQIIIIIIGTLLSIYMIYLNTNIYQPLDKAILPYLLLLISIISSTLAWYRINFILKQGYSLITINGYASIISGIIFSITTYHDNLINTIINISNFKYIMSLIIILTIISNIFCYNLYSKLLKKYSITTILFAELLCPCFTAYYQWIFFNIAPKINHFIFFILFMLCIIIFNYYDKKISTKN